MVGKLGFDNRLEQDGFEGVDEDEWVSKNYFNLFLLYILSFICSVRWLGYRKGYVFGKFCDSSPKYVLGK